MPKNYPEEILQQKINEELGGYAHSTDLRLEALKLSICEFLKFDSDKKEAFEKLVESNYQILLQISMESVENENPGLAARLIDGQNPYSNNV